MKAQIKMEIKYSCGYCGCPLDENKEYIENIPDEYNPNNYEHTWCYKCYYDNYE